MGRAPRGAARRGPARRRRVGPAGAGPRYPRAGAGREINAPESVEVATAFLSPAFLSGQYRFLRKKKKHRLAAMFLGLRATHPLWSRLL